MYVYKFYENIFEKKTEIPKEVIGDDEHHKTVTSCTHIYIYEILVQKLLFI